MIVRTAGAERSKAEIKRDYEYLLRLWNEIRELTLRSTAPALIYEEGNLIKRSIRDLYTRDIDEVLVEGEEGYRTAKAFMKMLMPSHAKRVQPYRDPQIGLFHRFQVESQIDAIHSHDRPAPLGRLCRHQPNRGTGRDRCQFRALDSRAQHRGDGDAHQSRSRRGDRPTAEVTRPCRTDRDRFHRHGGAPQSGGRRASAQRGLEERPRPHPGRADQCFRSARNVAATAAAVAGRNLDPTLPALRRHRLDSLDRSTALYVLRSIEEEGMRRRSAEISVHVPTMVALYILNQKRDSLVQLESRYGIRVMIAQDDALVPPTFRIERLRAYLPAETAVVPAAPLTQAPPPPEEEEEDETEEAVESAEAEQEDGEERGRSRRRRRRRRRHEEEPVSRLLRQPRTAASNRQRKASWPPRTAAPTARTGTATRKATPNAAAGGAADAAGDTAGGGRVGAEHGI